VPLIFRQNCEESRPAADPVGNLRQSFRCGTGAESVEVFNAALKPEPIE
jgi:hypothetical protein